MKIELEAHAKINWTLEVLGVRPDGYHEIRSVVLPISLHDDVSVSLASGVTCEMDVPGVPQDSNLAYRAAMALKEATGCMDGAKIEIRKRIPVGAGLGGGSADAAAVLNGLNRLWGLDLSGGEICGIAARIGSDVPALALGGAVMMEGRGERVRPLTDEEASAYEVPPSLDDLIVHFPDIAVSTAAVYREFRTSDRGLGPNDLQPAALRLHPGIADAIADLGRQGLRRVTMSGSGSAVYGLRQEPGSFAHSGGYVV